MKERVNITLRQRRLSSGRTTLYLDVTSGGSRHTESLGLFLLPETGRESRQKNKETIRFAEAILAKRMLEARNGEYGFRNDSGDDILFHDYFQTVAGGKGAQTKKIWGNTLKHLEAYDTKIKSRKMSEITPKYIQGFKDYLESRACSLKSVKGGKPLANNSKHLYFTKLRTCMNKAVKDGVLASDPMRNIDGFRPVESVRMYLTLDEIKTLARTECYNGAVRRAFLFSCLTGIRFSDISSMTWGDVRKQGKYTRVIFRQRKTSMQEYLDISPHAAEMMGERKDDGALIFDMSQCDANYVLKKWVARAGISKSISFHCARHSFAVMMLDLGTNIYTVSKLLGHRELTTTQIYAKLLDKNKQAAISKIPNIL